MLMSMNKNPTCPRCQSGAVVKNGKIPGKQRFKCKDCDRQFTRLTPRGHPASEKAAAIKLYAQGLSMRAIARMFHVSPSAVAKWIRNFARKNYEKPAPSGPVNVEVDEMWHFLHVKKNKLWIWKALSRETGQLIDWDCGNRDASTFQRLMHRLKRWNVKVFHTDH